MARRSELSESGEQIVGRLTPTGREARSSYRSIPSTIRKAAAGRKKWEASETGQARTTGITPETHGMTAGQYHFERNYNNPTIGPRHYDEQLPGMADPDAAPRPPRWHELSEAQQGAATAGARAHGTSLDKMTSDMGAQLDQAVTRAATFGHARGHAEDFYSTGRPREVIDQSAKDLGIPKTIHAQMNAMTSPNTKFSAHRGGTGEVYYPNDEAAQHAVRHVQQTGSDKLVTNNLEHTGTGRGKAQGYTTNVRKAASSFHQHQQGVRPGDWITSKDGTAGPFDSSPKTGPYANSWNDSHPQFTVSDVHTGGGGFLPHLSSSKPISKDKAGKVKYDDSGRPERDKSAREQAVASIPHFHTMADHAMRGAMGQRNMPSVRDAQALQWGEEQIQRKLVNPQDAYPKPQSRTQKRETKGQISLFE